MLSAMAENGRALQATHRLETFRPILAKRTGRNYPDNLRKRRHAAQNSSLQRGVRKLRLQMSSECTSEPPTSRDLTARM
jgi:hypothetical protein